MLNAQGQTPLYAASIYGNPESMKLLLGSGAKIDIRDADGNTPLHATVLYRNSKNLDENDQMNEKYFLQAIPAGTFKGWVAENEKGQIVSSIGLVVDIHPPAPNNPSGKIGYIMNLVVDNEHRRQGIARTLMRTVLEYLRNNKVYSAELHATEIGRGLYEELGFKDSNAMRIKL